MKKIYRRPQIMKNVHSYVIRYLTHNTIGRVNRYEVNNSYLTMDEIVKHELIGSSENDYPIQIVDMKIDGKKVSSKLLNHLNKTYFNNSIDECDGGDAGGGDIGGGDGASISGEITGTTTTDVLGTNEPGKGYMGPGNFYIPSKVKFPLHRWEVSNGGSQRKKTKKGKNKKYSYEKGMKVVVDMFENESSNNQQHKIDKPKIMSKLKRLSSQIKNLNDVRSVEQDFSKNTDKIQQRFNNSQFKQQKNIIIDFGKFLKDICTGQYKCSWFTITMIATAILYVISPIDIIPDAIPVIGIIDDAFVINMIYNVIKDEFEEWRNTKI